MAASISTRFLCVEDAAGDGVEDLVGVCGGDECVEVDDLAVAVAIGGGLVAGQAQGWQRVRVLMA